MYELQAASAADRDLRILQSYVTALMDISFQEVNIHFQPHTQVLSTGCPYTELENLFVSQSVAFNLENWSLFAIDLKLFSDFLDNESSTISQVFLNRTYFKYYNQVGSVFLDKVEEKIEQVSMKPSDICEREAPYSDSSVEDNKRISKLAEILSFVRSSGDKRPYEMQGFDEIICQRTNSTSADDFFQEASELWTKAGPEVDHLIDFHEFIVSSVYGSRPRSKASTANSRPWTLRSRGTMKNQVSHSTWGYKASSTRSARSSTSSLRLNRRFLEDLMCTSPEQYEEVDELDINQSHETGQDQDSEEDFDGGFMLAGIERSVNRGFYA